ncbi:MAG: hypothetical protein U0836_17330 [Pirellulales bacterium]
MERAIINAARFLALLGAVYIASERQHVLAAAIGVLYFVLVAEWIAASPAGWKGLSTRERALYCLLIAIVGVVAMILAEVFLNFVAPA